jgi:hypothetical protein
MLRLRKGQTHAAAAQEPAEGVAAPVLGGQTLEQAVFGAGSISHVLGADTLREKVRAHGVLLLSISQRS